MWPWHLRYRSVSWTWHAASLWWTYVPSFLEILWCMVEMRAGQGIPIKQYSFWPSTSKYDLDIWGTGLGLARDTPPHHGEHLCQVSLKSYNAWLKWGPDKVSNSAKFLSNPMMHGEDTGRTRLSVTDGRTNRQTDRRNRPNLRTVGD